MGGSVSHISKHVISIGDKLPIPGSDLSITVTGVNRHSEGGKPAETKVELTIETDYERKQG